MQNVSFPTHCIATSSNTTSRHIALVATRLLKLAKNASQMHLFMYLRIQMEDRCDVS